MRKNRGAELKKVVLTRVGGRWGIRSFISPQLKRRVNPRLTLFEI